MNKNELTYRRTELKKQAGRLLNHDRKGFKKLNQNEQGELQEILLKLISLDIKVTSPDPNINTQAARIRKKKKHSNNLQLTLTF